MSTCLLETPKCQLVVATGDITASVQSFARLKPKTLFGFEWEFPPVVFGTGKAKRPAGEKLSGHVLGRFKRHEQDDVDRALKEADEALALIMSEGIEKAMNKYN